VTVRPAVQHAEMCAPVIAGGSVDVAFGEVGAWQNVLAVV
jgi:hypothetical protein